MEKYDFSGWATKANLKCSDGRTILKDAFKHCDGLTVPLVWGHQHNEPFNVLGHALLENREEGVYTYGKFNDTEQGQNAKALVQHGDIVALSIYANKLKQEGSNVLHGAIREVSLVLAGANPGAFIDSVICHGEESTDEAVIFTGEDIMLAHAEEETKTEETKTDKDDNDDETIEDVFNTLTDKQKDVVNFIVGKIVEDQADDDEEEVTHADSDSETDKKDDEKAKDSEDDKDSKETVGNILKTLSEKQMNAVCYVLGTLSENQTDKKEGEETDMKHNVFENEKETQNVLSHSAKADIISLAKKNNVGSLRTAMNIVLEEELAHADKDLTNFIDAEGNDAIDTLFPEFKNVKPGAPEFIQRDQTWVDVVMKKAHKSPFSRIRTRQADIRSNDLRAMGYAKGNEKKLGAAITLLSRTTDPQTIYRKDALNRDDIIDITDFDVVDYQYKVMKQNLNEEIAMAIMVGDGREEGQEGKISEAHVRSILNDDELYTIHTDVDIAKAKAELQGSNTSANFGDNYVYAEAIITSALYSREKYKGTGTPDFYCTPHLLNVMLLARDLNGRRIYDSVSDLAAALNVASIHTVEQFEGKKRTTKDGKTKNLLGIFVNLSDYQIGSTKGGEITKFSQFDIDFNQEKYLIETRISGALVKPFSAIVLEEPAAE